MFRCVVIGCLYCIGNPLIAQHDTSYYTSYSDMLTGRLYFSKKYTTFRYNDKRENIRLRYVPNTTLNMGVGATYKWATLNLAYGLGFLNPDRGRGETKYLDLQGHIYGKKLLLDFIGQLYRGFYLDNTALRDPEGNYYARRDIRINEFGFTIQYMSNARKFSYRAGFLQNEWQKRSAGTFLIGWQLLAGLGLSDSTIIPATMRTTPAPDVGNELSFLETGPTAGYAYTLVVEKNFFVMASATLTFDIGFNSVRTLEEETSVSFVPNFGIKAFAGYNSERAAISLTFSNETTNLKGGGNDQLFGISTGNLRLNFVYRFDVSEALANKGR